MVVSVCLLCMHRERPAYCNCISLQSSCRGGVDLCGELAHDKIAFAGRGQVARPLRLHLNLHSTGRMNPPVTIVNNA